MPRHSWRRWLRALLWSGGAALLCVLLLVLAVVSDGYLAFGQGPRGARLVRMKSSPQWADGIFKNPQEIENHIGRMLRAVFHGSSDASPRTKIETLSPAEVLKTRPASGLRVTWLGHSTLLVELDGSTIMTDPVWGPRTSPVDWAGPERWYPPPLAFADLPHLDAILISHDHYDHLDYPTILELSKLAVTFIAPLGVGQHLEYWGVPRARIVELDWWQKHQAGALGITCVPARHASGRTPFDRDRTLWAGYALHGATHSVYFSGDTGLFPAMREIGTKLGPFDLTMIEVGAYNQAWPDWHLGPEQAVLAHQFTRGKVLLPIHWGLFQLASHAWTEPMERVLAAARPLGIPVLTPRPGQSLEPSLLPKVERWWPDIPWRSGSEDPIVASKMDIAPGLSPGR